VIYPDYQYFTPSLRHDYPEIQESWAREVHQL